MISPISIHNDLELAANLSDTFSCPCHNQIVAYNLPSGHTVQVSSQLNVNYSRTIERIVIKPLFRRTEGEDTDIIVGSIEATIQGFEAKSQISLQLNSTNARGVLDKKMYGVFERFQRTYNSHWEDPFPLDHDHDETEVLELKILSEPPRSKKTSILKEKEAFVNNPRSEGTEVY